MDRLVKIECGPLQKRRQLGGRLRSKRLQVAAPAEHLSRPRQHYRSHGGVFFAFERRLFQLARHLEVDRVGGVRPIQRQVGDAALKLIQQLWHLESSEKKRCDALYIISIPPHRKASVVAPLREFTACSQPFGLRLRLPAVTSPLSSACDPSTM